MKHKANPSWWGPSPDFKVPDNLDTQDVLDEIDRMIDQASSPGNYDFDPYLHGMVNGMIYVRSIISGEEPQYLEAPERWLGDRETKQTVAAGFRAACTVVQGALKEAEIPDTIRFRGIVYERVIHEITFPAPEIDQLAGRIEKGKPIFTTRVMEEYGKYEPGTILHSPQLEVDLMVMSVCSYIDIQQHPFYKELSESQRKTLAQGKYDLVELVVYPVE